MLNIQKTISQTQSFLIDTINSKSFSNLTYVGLVQFSNHFVMFLLIVGIKRLLGVEALGVYSTGFAFATIVFMITDLSLFIVVTREIARVQSEGAQILGNALTIDLLSVGLTCLAVLLFAPFLPYSTQIIYAIFFFSLVNGFRRLGILPIGVFRAYQENKYELQVIFIKNGLLLGFGAVALSLSHMLYPFLAVMVMAQLVMAIYGLFLVARRFFSFKLRFDKTWIKRMIMENWPLSVTTTLTLLIARNGIIILSLLQNEETVGYYAMAYNFYIVMTGVQMPILAIMLPRLSQQFVQSRQEIKRLYKRFLLPTAGLGIMVALVAIVFASLIIKLVYGVTAEHTLIVFSLRIMAISVVFQLMANVTLVTMYAVNLQRYTMIAMTITLITGILVNFLLVTLWSVIGASLGILLTDLCMWLTAFIFLYLKFFRKLPSNAFQNPQAGLT